jgi:3-oxoacyl-[acyl-carrier-protein] synthase-3
VPVYLHSIGSALGAPAPIRELPQLAADPMLAEYLASSGLEHYRRADETPPELAARAIRATLDRAGLDPRQIDTVVWGSTSFQDRAWYTTDVSRVLREAGLATATPIGTTLSECGNLAAVLRVATALVAAGHAHVLAVVTDRAAGPAHRLVPPSVAVLSDGAAACIVSAEPRGFEIVAIRQVTNHRARPDAEDQAVRVLRHNAEGMRRAAQAVLAAAGVAPGAITHVIANNLARAVLELFAAQCRVDFARVFRGHVAGHGHVFAADGLINLAAAGAARGETVLLATNGTCNWGAALLGCAGGEP